MSVGRREGGAQEELFIVAEELRSTGSPFYRALNRVLAEGGFEGVCEEACRVYKYGNHLTPSPRSALQAAVFTSFLVDFFRVLGLRIPFLKT